MVNQNTKIVTGIAFAGLAGLVVGYTLKSSNPETIIREVPVITQVTREPEHKFTHVRTKPNGEEVYRYEVWHEPRTLEDVANAFNASDLSSGDKYDDISGGRVVTADGKPIKEVSMKGFAYVVAKKKKIELPLKPKTEPRVKPIPPTNVRPTRIDNPKPQEKPLKNPEIKPRPEEDTQPKQPPAVEKPKKVTFAILINNDNDGGASHMANLMQAYQTLKARGINPCDIYMIADSVPLSHPIECPSSFSSLDLPPSLESLRVVIADLEKKSRSQDRLIIYSTGHGTKEGIGLEDGVFTYRDLRRKLQAMDIGFVLGISDTCLGGSFPEAFKGFPKKGLFWSPFDAGNNGLCGYVTPHFWDLVGKGVSYDLNIDNVTSLSELAIFIDGIYEVARHKGRKLTIEEVETLRIRSLQSFLKKVITPELLEGVVVTTGGIYDATFDGRIITKKPIIDNSPIDNNPLVDLNPNNYRREVITSPVPVIVDVYTTWCPPCKRLAEEIETIRPEYAGIIKFTRIDYESDGAREVVRKNGNPDITSYPTLLLYDNGKLVGTERGLKSAGELEDLVERNFKIKSSH